MRNSQDIVYICFWQFEQIWTDEAHSELIEMLENYLGNWWVLPDENQLNRTLNDIWNQPYLPADEGRLLIAYVRLRYPKEIMKMERHFSGLQRWLQK